MSGNCPYCSGTGNVPAMQRIAFDNMVKFAVENGGKATDPISHETTSTGGIYRWNSPEKGEAALAWARPVHD